MGIGSFPAGMGPAGGDPIPDPSAPIFKPPIQAAKFDIGTKTQVQASNGTLVSVHPVDQEVNLRLGIEEKQIASAVTVGHRIRQITRSGGPDVQSRVIDAVNIALADPLARKDIKILGVDVDAKTVRGRIVVAVNYLNLRTQKAQKATVK